MSAQSMECSASLKDPRCCPRSGTAVAAAAVAVAREQLTPVCSACQSGARASWVAKKACMLASLARLVHKQEAAATPALPGAFPPSVVEKYMGLPSLPMFRYWKLIPLKG